MKIKTAFWHDLTGQSDRWVRTVIYAVLSMRLLFAAIAILVVFTIGEDAEGGISEMIEGLGPDWMVVALIYAPVFESLAIGVFVFVAGHKAGWGWPVWATALVCGVLAVPAHGLNALSISAGPAFALMAAIQHNWMAKGRGWAGLGLIILIHFLSNAMSTGMWVIGAVIFPP